MDVGGSSIPNGGPPLSFVSGPINVPSNGPGPEYGRRIKATAIGGGSHTHAPNAEWQVAYDYFLKPMPQLKYHLKLFEHQYLWINQTSRATNAQVSQQQEVLLNLFCLNDVLRRGWLLAVNYLEPLVDLHQGTLNPKAGIKDTVENRNAFLNWLTKPEIQWTHLFAANSTLLQRSDAFTAMVFLAKEGILTKYKPLGIVLARPQIQYGPTELPRDGSRMQVTVEVEGQATVTNVWGKRAAQGAYLFLILKRVKDPRTGHEGPFQIVPYANLEKTVPLQMLQYHGVSGNVEFGHAWLVGRVIDVLGTPFDGELLEKVQGLRGSVDENLRASNEAAKIKILLYTPQMVY